MGVAPEFTRAPWCDKCRTRHVEDAECNPSAPSAKWVSLLRIMHPSAKPSDPLRDQMPGGWPIVGDLEALAAYLDRLEGATNPADHAKKLLDEMTDEERLELFRKYCRACGSKDPSCTCTADPWDE